MSSLKQFASKKEAKVQSSPEKSVQKKSSSTLFTPKKASHQTSAPPPLPPDTSAPFSILIVEPYRLYSRALHMDIRKEELFHTHVERVSSFQEAERAIVERPPQAVILSLQLPDNGTQRFFERYPADSRPFALILFDYRLETEGASPLSAREYQNNFNLIAEQQTCGYLCVGLFTNRDLTASLERARKHVQNLLLQEQQQHVIASLEEYLHHPFVIAVSKYVQSMSRTTQALSPRAMAGALRFVVSREEYLVAFDRILRVEGDGKYCHIFYYNARNILESKYIEKKWITNALPESLVRIHRTHWVNIVYICQIEEKEITLFNGDILPLTSDGRKILQDIFSHHSLQLYNIALLQNSFSEQEKSTTTTTTTKSSKALQSPLLETIVEVVSGGGVKYINT